MLNETASMIESHIIEFRYLDKSKIILNFLHRFWKRSSKILTNPFEIRLRFRVLYFTVYFNLNTRDIGNNKPQETSWSFKRKWMIRLSIFSLNCSIFFKESHNSKWHSLAKAFMQPFQMKAIISLSSNKEENNIEIYWIV